jgi:galactitol-specific phosphotransferase system IIC component
MAIGMHAGLIAGSSARNCAVPAIAVGQIALASIPLFTACVVSGNLYLHVYAGIVALHFVAALLRSPGRRHVFTTGRGDASVRRAPAGRFAGPLWR